MPQTTTIGFEQLSKYFHLPINDVAKELGICATMLKKICRRNSIPRWPHRKIKSLNKMIENLESSLQNNPSEAEECIKQEITILKNKKTLIMKNPSILASNAQKRTSLMGSTSGDNEHGKPVKKSSVKQEQPESSQNNNILLLNTASSSTPQNNASPQSSNTGSNDMIKLSFSHNSQSLQLPLPSHQISPPQQQPQQPQQQQQQQQSQPQQSQQQTNFSINHLLTPAYSAPLTSFLLEDEDQLPQQQPLHQQAQHHQVESPQQTTTTYITTTTQGAPHSISYQHQNPTMQQQRSEQNDMSWYQAPMNPYLASTPMYQTQVVTAHPDYFTLPKLNIVEGANSMNQQIIQSQQGPYITSQIPQYHHQTHHQQHHHQQHHQLPLPHQTMQQNQQNQSKVIYMKSAPTPPQNYIQTIIPNPPQSLRWMVSDHDKINISRKM
ncbi:RWP-RK domain-containing protein [Tieghemostelium lacteum]|uniref:RWP-RK domain-containing protein n=1 Tax=Tieghemostelium lacteum TaxID=361077 RepID=A0A151Z5Q2_TIELA|nr:RWP-RK domain-containing protein [Tieghemostelium lacteum]|eukprot:KYQ89275.1 RWP-RK domain-containing protein [Tieghemostelium lacteum]